MFLDLSIAAYFIALGYIDFKYKVIPDKLIAVGLLLSIPYLVNFPFESLVSGIVVGGVMWVLAAITEGGVGGGDIKISAVTGLLFGYYSVVILSLAVVLCYVWVIFKNQKTNVPFGPFLAVSGVLGLFT